MRFWLLISYKPKTEKSKTVPIAIGIKVDLDVIDATLTVSPWGDFSTPSGEAERVEIKMHKKTCPPKLEMA